MPRWRLALLAAALLGAGLALYIRTAPPPPEAAAPAPAPTRAPFGVLTGDGPLHLDELRGRAVIVYFGYTACPDFCPTTLATVAAAVRRLPEADQPRATALMVSVDPERDTPERLSEYARYFHPGFYGGTRPLPEITEIARDWGVVFRKANAGASAMGYAVDHSTDAFLLGPDGRFLRAIPHGTSAEALAAAFTEALGPSEAEGAGPAHAGGLPGAGPG